LSLNFLGIIRIDYVATQISENYVQFSNFVASNNKLAAK
jgi:hypothetical protein